MNYIANGKVYKLVPVGVDGVCCSICAFGDEQHEKECRDAPCGGGYFVEDESRPVVLVDTELQAVCRRALLNIYGDTWREDMAKLLDKIDGETK